MKIFVDESGQTGCVIQKKEILNFINSPTFALAAIVVDNEKIDKLEQEYKKFKKKFSISDEIKGSDLLTKKNNDKLKYFIDNVLSKANVYINIYDKRFYLSTLLLFSFCGLECLENYKYDIYNQASILSRQKDEFFVEYLKFIEKPNELAFRKYLDYLISYDYEYFSDINGVDIENILVLCAKVIKADRLEHFFIHDFMTYGWYDDEKITNLINLNCFCELIYFVKSSLGIDNTKVELIHDKIDEFEDIIMSELSPYNFNIKFENSIDSNVLQIADNVVSIIRHSFDKCMNYCINNKMWEKASIWDLKLFSQLQRIIKTDNIKYTVSLPDWAASLSIKEMFSDNYPNEYRNNLHFNNIYKKELSIINNELLNNLATLKNVDDILNT